MGQMRQRWGDMTEKGEARLTFQATASSAALVKADGHFAWWDSNESLDRQRQAWSQSVGCATLHCIKSERNWIWNVERTGVACGWARVTCENILSYRVHEGHLGKGKSKFNSRLLSQTKEWSNATCSNMDRPRGDHTEWSKSDRDKYHRVPLTCGILNKIIQANLFMK